MVYSPGENDSGSHGECGQEVQHTRKTSTLKRMDFDTPRAEVDEVEVPCREVGLT